MRWNRLYVLKLILIGVICVWPLFNVNLFSWSTDSFSMILSFLRFILYYSRFFFSWRSSNIINTFFDFIKLIKRWFRKYFCMFRDIGLLILGMNLLSDLNFVFLKYWKILLEGQIRILVKLFDFINGLFFTIFVCFAFPILIVGNFNFLLWIWCRRIVTWIITLV